MIDVSIANEQPAEIDEDRLKLAIERVMAAEREGNAAISLAIVDNAAIHALNREFLEHDYPTDVLSFVLEDLPGELEGEIVVSAEMAAEQAGRYGWSAADELLLYVIHGALHLVGYDDLEPAAETMRAAEARHLKTFGLSGR